METISIIKNGNGAPLLVFSSINDCPKNSQRLTFEVESDFRNPITWANGNVTGVGINFYMRSRYSTYKRSQILSIKIVHKALLRNLLGHMGNEDVGLQNTAIIQKNRGWIHKG